MDTTRKEDFDGRRRFDDGRADNRRARPAHEVDLSRRGMDCWGLIAGKKEPAAGATASNAWSAAGSSTGGCHGTRGRRQDGRRRVGRPANYRADARFVLKLLPDMDRDKAKVDQRIEASLEEDGSAAG